MNKISKIIPILLVALALVSTCKSESTIEYLLVIKKWEGEGWLMGEILGVAGESITSVHIASPSARSVKAFWVENGARKEKKYVQSEKQYLILHFEKANGDSFCVVLSKLRS